MVVATFESELPNLRQTLAAVPEATLSVADVRTDDRGRTWIYFWVEYDDADRFDAALADDETVDRSERVTHTDRGCLYRIHFGEAGELGIEAYEAIVEFDGLMTDCVSNGTCWRTTVVFPDRETLSGFYERSRELGLAPRLDSLQVDDDRSGTADFGLTGAQRQTLETAAQAGYFQVPKRVSLIGLADRLDVSDQAVSERLRRGMASLVDATIRDGDEAGGPGDQDDPTRR